MNKENLLKIIQNGEGKNLEFKSNFNNSVIETLVAFSNAVGGRVFIGVDDKGDIKGIDIGKESIQKWMNEIKQNTIPAIRELLLNAIVHKDYTDPTDVIIKIFDESIEITNPGRLTDGLTIEDILSDNYIPKHRNKLLTEAFYLTGDIEKYGTGFSRLKEWFIPYQDLRFMIKELTNFIQVSMVKIENITTNDGLSDGLSDRLNDGLNERQKITLKNIKENPGIKIKELSIKLNIPIAIEQINIY